MSVTDYRGWHSPRLPAPYFLVLFRSKLDQNPAKTPLPGAPSTGLFFWAVWAILFFFFFSSPGGNDGAEHSRWDSELGQGRPFILDFSPPGCQIISSTLAEAQNQAVKPCGLMQQP